MCRCRSTYIKSVHDSKEKPLINIPGIVPDRLLVFCVADVVFVAVLEVVFAAVFVAVFVAVLLWLGSVLLGCCSAAEEKMVYF